MLGLLVFAVVLVIVLGLAAWIVQQLPLPPPFKTAALVLIGLITLIVLLSLLLGWMPLPHHFVIVR